MADECREHDRPGVAGRPGGHTVYSALADVVASRGRLGRRPTGTPEAVLLWTGDLVVRQAETWC